MSGHVHTKLTEGEQNRNSVFCDKSTTIWQHLWNLSATSFVFWNSTESRRRSVKIKSFLFCCKFHYLQAVLSAVGTFRRAEDVDLTAGMWSTGETCKFIFFVCLMFATPKNAPGFIYLFWYLWFEECKASCSRAYVLIFFRFPWSATWCINFIAAVCWM
jgi:hypothetical protein